MEKIINFSDYKNELLVMIKEAKCTYNNIEEAANILSLNKLRYNIQNGKTYNNIGSISEYCSKKDIPTYNNIEEVIRCELLPYFKNECVRIEYFKKTNQKYYY